jgi:hypothetical protein
MRTVIGNIAHQNPPSPPAPPITGDGTPIQPVPLQPTFFTQVKEAAQDITGFDIQSYNPLNDEEREKAAHYRQFENQIADIASRGSSSEETEKEIRAAYHGFLSIMKKASSKSY